MALPSVLSLAHQCVAAALEPGATAIDATAGNGYDTLFLADQVGPNGRVFAFDVQQQALRATRARLERADAIAPVTLLHQSHDTIPAALPNALHGTVEAAMFNLGYLPRSDKAIITAPETTLPALDHALALLRPGGLLTAVLYRGHAGGPEEADAVRSWAAALDSDVARTRAYGALNRPTAPELVIVQKRDR